MLAPAEEIAAVLGGPGVLGRAVHTHEQLMKLVAAGLPYGSFEALAERSRVGVDELGEIVGIPKATRSRRRQTGALAPDESDRICRFARVFAHALSVFEDSDEAAHWFATPNIALGKEIPLSVVATDLGAQQVDQALIRIEQGIFS